MPLQNRVTPFGELIATPARGTLMGNRGCLHDATRRIRRPFAVKRWIICVLEFKGRHRKVMTPGQYYDLFRTHWAGRVRTLPGADDMDDVLHAERIGRQRAKRTYTERLSRLPSGTMVADDDGHAYLVDAGALRPWTLDG